MDNKKLIATLIEHPDVSFQVIITQKIDGSIEIVFIDHVSKAQSICTEKKMGTNHPFIEICKTIVNKAKNTVRDVVFFKK